VAERLRYVQERAGIAERRATEVRERIGALKLDLVDEDSVRQAFSRFDPVWETLTPREQERLVHLLVQRVDYDGPNENVSITFYPAGIAALSREAPKGEDRRFSRQAGRRRAAEVLGLAEGRQQTA
jgi:site-specific DNA recombinase